MGRREPERMCVGCRQSKGKKDLLRVSLKKDGTPVFDPASGETGRGAYICRNSDCIRLARKNHGLERSFKRRIPKETAEKLFEEMESYLGK